MTTILRYSVIGMAMLALSLSAAGKEDASPAAKQVSAGAEAGAQAGVETGLETGSA